ncbi:tyrosine-type recombinase/integrase [Flavobacterium piscis]|uniref:Integrase n=1 Tax=Flavobacterium piscis TaxID=1114874 RepID=A0ABU1Y4F6_9FLAO|nr:tyrosine-type recombinase/integrase [Flavobacterium piscis]MDR7208406.1 integrase [Flavobacterium piscis]
MATVNFLYRSTKDKSALTIRLLFRHNNMDFVIGSKTKLIVTNEYWNKLHNKNTKDAELKTQQVKTNNELNKIENYILQHFDKTKTDSVNKSWLENLLNNYYNPPKKGDGLPIELIQYIDFYINYREHEMKQTSIQKFKVIKHKLEELETLRRKPILIKDVDDSFKKEFVNFYKSHNYAQNTIQRELTFVKTVCRHARFLGLETSPQLDSLRLDKAKVEKLYLNFDELHSIENINEELSASLQNARDWLIISCYTGQRVSDFMKFNENQIRIENGKSLIEFTQKKTGKIMTVPLHKKVLDILAKRGGKFPYSISDQRYNEFIKTVCEKAKINQLVHGGKQTETAPKSKIFRKEIKMYKKYELVTSHIGRRSFATNFYGIIPTSLLISATGHSTEVMFLNYIGKTDTQKAKQLADYF